MIAVYNAGCNIFLMAFRGVHRRLVRCILQRFGLEVLVVVMSYCWDILEKETRLMFSKELWVVELVYDTLGVMKVKSVKEAEIQHLEGTFRARENRGILQVVLVECSELNIRGEERKVLLGLGKVWMDSWPKCSIFFREVERSTVAAF